MIYDEYKKVPTHTCLTKTHGQNYDSCLDLFYNYCRGTETNKKKTYNESFHKQGTDHQHLDPGHDGLFFFFKSEKKKGDVNHWLFKSSGVIFLNQTTNFDHLCKIY